MSDVQHVSDTALWVAHYRAEETARTDALFKDPFAQRLSGEKGRSIARKLSNVFKYTGWNVIIRTVVIDRYVKTLVDQGIDTVINLGAGLDARPYRMDLPASLSWIEVDHAHMIDHKEKILSGETPRCRLERHRLDLSDRQARRAFFSDVSKRTKRALILTEGILPYLTEDQVSDLAEDLRVIPPFEYWIAEYFSKFMYRYISHPRRVRALASSPFRFFPQDWYGFFSQRGWQVKETQYLGEEGVKLGRAFPLPWWGRLYLFFADPGKYAQFLRMTGYVLFSKT